MRVFYLKNSNEILGGNNNLREKKFTTLSIKNITGFIPNSLSYYEEAFTHRSISQFTKNNISYERLEFLGDAILNTIVTEYLFYMFPNKQEGYLTQMRAKIVNRTKLNSIGNKLGLEKYVRFDKKSFLSKNFLGDIYEAVIGAIFLDYGIDNCRKFVQKTLLSNDIIKKLEQEIISYKSLLLEYSQKKKFNYHLLLFLKRIIVINLLFIFLLFVIIKI